MSERWRKSTRRAHPLLTRARSIVHSDSLLTRAWLVFLAIDLLTFTIIVATSLGTAAAPEQQHLQNEVGPWNSSSVINPRKIALILETRPVGLLIPLILHFTSVLPPDWQFRFMGSDGSVAFLRSVPAMRRQIDAGKVETVYLPSNITTNNQEQLSVFLTDPWTYTSLLAPADLVFLFQTDSIVCANSDRNFNEFAHFSWVGAPWGFLEYGGNGGLSLRNVSVLVDVLEREPRPPGTLLEDQFIVDRMIRHQAPGMAPRGVSKHFSAETMYSYHPMAYHTGNGGGFLNGPVWGNPGLRAELYDWCPEVKMGVDMDVLEFLPGECNPLW